MQSLITIIVPVYKVEEYLDLCVQSILNQSYKNFELILVDDGSPDRCPVLCDQYAAQYKNVRVLHKENGGLSDARNTGMKIAKGEYVTFIDSDDYVHPLYLELLLDAVVKKHADFSICGFDCVFDGNGITYIDKNIVDINLYDAKAALCKVLYQKFHDVSAWGILLPLELARKFPFPKGKRLEDLLTTYKYYFAVKRVAFVFAPLYYYFQRSGSIMSDKDDGMFLDMITASNNLVQECKKDRTIEKAAINKRFSNFRIILPQLSDFKSRHPDIYNETLQTIKKDRWTIFLDKNSTWQNKISAGVFSIGGIKGLDLLYKLKNFVKRHR